MELLINKTLFKRIKNKIIKCLRQFWLLVRIPVASHSASKSHVLFCGKMFLYFLLQKTQKSDKQ